MSCNYRPIRLLPVLSKVLEKIASEQLMHLRPTIIWVLCNLIQGQPFYRIRYLIINRKYQTITWQGKCSWGSISRSKKAFDTVNHNSLISKLAKFNLSKLPLYRFESYLKGRKQCVIINNVKSTSQNWNRDPSGHCLGTHTLQPLH